MIKDRFLFFFFAACFLLFLVVCRPLGLYFLCDDFAHVPEAAQANLFQTHLLRPVANLSLWLDSRFWGFSAEGYHLTNLLIHLLNTILLFFLTKAAQFRYSRSFSQDKQIPFFTAFLFLCYAFHSEPIFWIVGRGGSLCTIFLQASLSLYLRKTGVALLLSLVSFAIALFTYELSWAFPLLITVLFLYERRVLKLKSGLGTIAFYWLILAVFLWYRFGLLHYPLPYGTASEVSGNFPGLLRNFGALMARLFVPPVHSGMLFFVLCLCAVTLILILLFSVRKRSMHSLSGVILLVCCCIVAVLPVVPLGIDTHDSESERFIYFASVFACLFFVFLLASVIKQKQLFNFIVSVLILLNLFELFHSSQSYRYASGVSKKLVETLNTHSNVKKINFINLPTQYRGALLFRIGFVVNKAGILKKTYDVINVISYKEVTEDLPLTIIDKYKQSGKEELTVEYNGRFIQLY